VHRSLDLALAQEWVHRPPDVVNSQNVVDLARFAVEHDELGRVRENRMDNRVLETVLERVGPVHAVLAFVVDTGPAPIGDGVAAGVGDGASAHQCPAGTGRLAGPELASGVDDDSHPSRIDAELLDSDLEGDGVDSLAHLGPAMPNLD